MTSRALAEYLFELLITVLAVVAIIGFDIFVDWFRSRGK